VKIDADKALQEMRIPERPPIATPAAPGASPVGSDPLAPPKSDDGDDKMKGLMDAIKSESEKKKP
jgi:hypothetical protein